MRELHRVCLEVEVERDVVSGDPSEWDVDDLARGLSAGAVEPRRVLSGLVVADSDATSVGLDAFARYLDETVRLHWATTSSPAFPLQPAPGSPRPSLETLVELRALEEQVRRLAERLRGERL